MKNTKKMRCEYGQVHHINLPHTTRKQDQIISLTYIVYAHWMADSLSTELFKDDSSASIGKKNKPEAVLWQRKHVWK